MDGIYGWVRNIVYYLIFMTIITNLLPAGKYEKYLRLFAGCILILLVVQPLTGGLRLEEKINAIFRSVSFENEAAELQGKLDEMEEKRLDRLVDSYEKSAEEELLRLAQEEGIAAANASVAIEKDSSSPNFGKVKKIVLKFKDAKGDSSVKESGAEGSGNRIVLDEVQKVSVRLKEKGADQSDAEVSSDKVIAGQGQQSREDEEIRKFRRTIAGYYQMEEENVEIRLED